VGLSGARAERLGWRWSLPWLVLVSVLVAGVFAAPFAYLVVRALGQGRALASVWTSRAALEPLARSLVLAVAVVVAATALGVAAAWLVARTDLPGRRAFAALLPLPLVIPSFIGAFVVLAAFSRGGVLDRLFGWGGLRLEGFWPSFVVLTLFCYPYVYLPVAARLKALPASLEESARLLGRRPLVAFFTVVLPQARASVAAGSLLVFLYVVSEFGVVQLFRYDTLTRVIYATRLFERDRSLALTLLLAAIALGVVAAERVSARRATAAGGRAGRGGLVVPLGRWRAPALSFLVAVVMLALGVPVGVLVFWVVRGWENVADPGALLPAMLNTAAASVGAAVAAVAAVLPVAYLTVRHRSRVGGIANAFVVAGFALPGLALALALVVVTLGAPAPVGRLYQTFPLLVFAYVVHFGAQALRGAQAALGAVPPRVEDAARVLGANRVQRLLRVELPLMAPGLLAAGGLVLLSSMKELPATLLLAPAGFQTLAMEVWQATESALFAQASLAALVLIALSGVLTWVLVVRRGIEPA
jgi:iron(III) transport system permease protein